MPPSIDAPHVNHDEAAGSDVFYVPGGERSSKDRQTPSGGV